MIPRVITKVYGLWSIDYGLLTPDSRPETPDLFSHRFPVFLAKCINYTITIKDCYATN